MGRDDRTSNVGWKVGGVGLDVGLRVPPEGLDVPLPLLHSLNPSTDPEFENRESCRGSWKRL